LEGQFLGPGGAYTFKPKCAAGACPVTAKQVDGTVTFTLSKGAYRGEVTSNVKIKGPSPANIIKTTYVVRPLQAELVDGQWRVSSAIASSVITSMIPADTIYGQHVPAMKAPPHKTTGRVLLQQ